MDDKTRALYFSLFNEIGIISQLSRAMMEARMPAGMLVSHFSVLNHLIRLGDGRTPLDIARAFQVPKTTMTHTLAGLEANGYIDMRPNPRDKRSKCVWLTEAGIDFRNETIRQLDPDLAAFQAAFPENVIEDIVPRLAAFRAMMDKHRDRTEGQETEPSSTYTGTVGEREE